MVALYEHARVGAVQTGATATAALRRALGAD
jgi:hypothetical protein